MDQAVQNARIACPVCDAPSAIFDVVDFNKNCEEARGLYLPMSGRPVYYHRCPECHFTFAPSLHAWSDDEFLKHIYNEQYVQVDPDYVKSRPATNAQFLSELFGEEKGHIRHLDYGGGNGILSAALREQGWQSQSYDPFPSNEQRIAELGKFNLITAFEVFEHVPDVEGLIKNLLSLMDEQCVVIFSTLLSDGQISPNTRLTWWYASPRNGHISLFSKRSMVLLAERHKLTFGSFNANAHCLINQLPSWAAKLMG